MTAEVAILRAYALASQRKYSEAKRMLGAVPEALRTTSGADLLARIFFEEGDVEAARHIWEQILRFDPANEAARKALAVPDVPRACIGTRLLRFCRKWKYACVPALALAAVACLFFGRACRRDETPRPQPVCQELPAAIAEQKLEITHVNGRVLAGLRDGILTNMTADTMLVISGGRGKDPSDRLRDLIVIADGVRHMTSTPFARIWMQVGEEPLDVVTLKIVPYHAEGCRQGTSDTPRGDNE